MISIADIRKKAERLYPEVLTCGLRGETPFPKSIRADKSLSPDFGQMSSEIALIMAHSKDRKGWGYRVLSKTVKTRQHGLQDIPSDVVFESLEDYLRFLGREQEYAQFLSQAAAIRQQLPQLEEWLQSNPTAVIAHLGDWEGLLKVCDWFLHRFEADRYYIRELPIAVHTKFIENNKGILRRLLDFLIPEKADGSTPTFEQRFRLKWAQPLLRYRLLDPHLEAQGYTDISVPLDQFAGQPLACRSVVVVENLMNFLTFPPLPEAIVLWGKGFAIEQLKEVDWLKDKSILYWSDLDAQGFQMLAQLRAYFPQTQSFLMDRQTLEQFREYAVVGTPCSSLRLENLSASEQEVFALLLAENLRLEQERIPQSYLEDKLASLALACPKTWQ